MELSVAHLVDVCCLKRPESAGTDEFDLCSRPQVNGTATGSSERNLVVLPEKLSC